MTKTSANKSTVKKPVAKESIATAKSYDDVPYDSKPFAQTNPLLLQSIGKLFGLNVPSPYRARILEIGCASGGNIMAIAAMFPESKCIGIDYSARQIETGRKEVAESGITNVELKHMSVADITPAFGKFDYIICHGVLSWVPPEVQEKIIEVSKNNLADDGIAYISYNTLPGWNSVRSLREMMRYHTASFPEPAIKAQQARLLLKFISDSMHGSNSATAGVVDRELALLNQHADYYLLHEHLEENNFPFYFHEFMERANKKGLQYLAETNIAVMFHGNLPAAAAEVLATSNDIVRTEQYMDFIYDRRFRSTLLCHSDRILNRNISPALLRDGLLVARFTYPDGLQNHDIKSGQVLHFPVLGNALTVNTSDPVTLAMLQVFQQQGAVPVSTKEFIARVGEKLKSVNNSFAQESLENTICTLAIRYVFTGGCVFFLEKMPYVDTVSKKPELSNLARFQSRRQDWITNLRQEMVNISPFDKFFMQYIDGTRTVDALCKAMLPHFNAKELYMNENDVPIEDENVIKEKLPEVVRGTLLRYIELGLLVK